MIRNFCVLLHLLIVITLVNPLIKEPYHQHGQSKAVYHRWM